MYEFQHEKCSYQRINSRLRAQKREPGAGGAGVRMFPTHVKLSIDVTKSSAFNLGVGTIPCPDPLIPILQFINYVRHLWLAARNITY